MIQCILRLSIFLVFAVCAQGQTTGFPADYYKMKPTVKKQDYFFNYLYPHIEQANQVILKDRAFILSLENNKQLKPASMQYQKLETLASKYGIKDMYDYKKLLKKIDIIPPSMALAQASVESGWGMSRFVKLGNNLFGHWTYGKKGIVPLQRAKGAKHLVRIFDSFEGSITAYMLNLNKGKAYYEFRNKRALLRNEDKEPRGLTLSQTMINYSGIGKKYLWILKRMITSNNLQQFDTKFFNTLKKDNNELYRTSQIRLY